MGTLLERDQQLSELNHLLDRAAGGEGSVVLVRGEAGIGKTSLVRRFLADVADQAHVLAGFCDDLVTATPFGPLRDMAVVEGDIQTALDSSDRHLVSTTMLELLSRSLRPTVMVIEDVHWADESTLDLLRFIGRRVETTHGLLILTHREEVGEAKESVRMAVGDLPSAAVTRIRLGPLSSDAVGGLAGRADVDLLMELSGGNPFLVTELIHMGEDDVPESIMDSVGARLSRLSSDARDLAGLISVIPGRAEVGLLERLHGGLKGPLIEGERSGLLLVESRTVRFRHELVRRAVEGDLPDSVRIELNARVLVALEEEGADPSRLAHHARIAGDVEAMLRILPLAARHAADAGSTREAWQHLSAMEPYLGALSAEERADHYDFWAYQGHVLGDDRAYELAQRAIELRRELGEPIALGKSLLNGGSIAWGNASALRANAMVHGYTDNVDEALSLLESASPADLASAYATAAVLNMVSSDVDRALHFGRKALAFDEASPEARSKALGVVGWVQFSLRYPEGVDELEEGYLVAEEAGLHQEQARAAGNLAALYQHVRMPSEARRWIERGLGVAIERQLALSELGLTATHLWVEVCGGNWDGIEEQAAAILDRSDPNHLQGRRVRLRIAEIQARRGAPDASRIIMGLWDEVRHSSTLMLSLTGTHALAERIWLAGDIPDDVIADLIEMMEHAFAREWVQAAGETAFYLYLAGHLSELPAKTPDPFRALIEGDWRKAASFWEERGIVYERALCLSFGDVEARLEALGILDELGAVPLATKVRESLHAEGVKGVPRAPSKVRRESVHGLTPRQTEILDLLAEDLSNAEIADRLFLSVRTVEHHVSSILTTLGASSRIEAVRIARAGSS